MQSLKKLLSCQRGTSLLLVALMIPLLLGVTGLVIDMGRLYAVQAKAQNASDAALLGAAATQSTTPVAQEMQKLFNANYPANYMGSTVNAINVTGNNGLWTAQFSVSVPTTVMHFFGQNTMTVNILSQVTGGLSHSISQHLELALVLDNTGSMQNPVDSSGTRKIDALHTAVRDLVNIIFGDPNTLDNVHISVVPFDTDIRLPADHLQWIQPNWRGTYNQYVNWSGGMYFIGNRNSDEPPNNLNDISDDPPTSNDTRFRVPHYYGCGFGNNWWCYPDLAYPLLTPMQFAMNNKTDIINLVNTMQPSGNTRINVGLMWGWFTLSPKWQGVWDAGKPGLPESPNSNLSKQMVLMTDGQNTVYFGWNGTSNDDVTTAQLCTAIKAQGITLYTIGFGLPGDVNENLLRNCATSPAYYFLAPSAAQLQTVFHQIADRIVQDTLRLSQ